MQEFLRLPLSEQADILNGAAPRLGRTATILQKDVWLCWALEKLFSMGGTARMVFKGGSSLSKVFHVIHRFSEDVDVTLDYRDLWPGEDPLAKGASRSRRARISDELRQRAQRQVLAVVKPRLEEELVELLGAQGAVEASPDGEKVWIKYPSGLGASDYIQERILIEFGGRNATEPSGPHAIRPDLASLVDTLAFPVAQVPVLSPQRTFWEKATLIHVECNRKGERDRSRLSRHWYDLTMLFRDKIGQEALADRDLLKDVVDHKKVFFHYGYANYDACLEGGFRLVPEGKLLADLARDFKEMEDAGMFDQPPPRFPRSWKP